MYNISAMNRNEVKINISEHETDLVSDLQSSAADSLTNKKKPHKRPGSFKLHQLINDAILLTGSPQSPSNTDQFTTHISASHAVQNTSLQPLLRQLAYLAWLKHICGNSGEGVHCVAGQESGC